ncbi:MAG: hypothetical protein ING60_04015 [Rhodocyclaceae bacterium]|nr:hypothetical protein [Rhodocyclaceae bacterium]
MAEAGRLSQRYAGKTCRYQPFDPDKETKLIQVSDNRGFQTMLISAEIMAGVVNGDYVAGDEYALSADLSAGWLVDMDTDIANLPRSTEYGGLIEHAVFMIVNSGIGKLNGSTSLQLDVHAPVDASFPRGSMTIGLANSQDQLVVGIDALDQLVAQYIRDGRIVYERTGLGHQSTQRLHLGVAVGSIAAVLVRVADLDAAASKKTKKAA